MNFKPITITARDIPDAWFQCIYNLFDNCFSYVIDKGSYEREIRYEYDFINIIIDRPYSEPYDLMLPQIPGHLNIPNPVANGYIEEYLPYLMTGEKLPNEDYTYGSRLRAVPIFEPEKYIDGDKAINSYFFDYDQIYYFINVLKDTPNTNQAILRICQPEDFQLKDPPCLCHIDMRIKENKLIFCPYFRSWSLWGGFPANLAAIAVLQKFMADELDIKIGPICASSKGLHLYGFEENIAKIRCYMNGPKEETIKS